MTLLTASRQSEIRFAVWKEFHDLAREAPV